AGNVWLYVLPDGVDYAELFKPSFWKSEAKHIRLWDSIRVYTDSNKFAAELLVTSANANAAFIAVSELWRRDLETVDYAAETIEGYSYEWTGGFDKFVIRRIADGHVMQRGLMTPEDCKY
ncbi:unnamed protein product, partial [Phaeothamnion confervicola]